MSGLHAASRELVRAVGVEVWDAVARLVRSLMRPSCRSQGPGWTERYAGNRRSHVVGESWRGEIKDL